MHILLEPKHDQQARLLSMHILLELESGPTAMQWFEAIQTKIYKYPKNIWISNSLKIWSSNRSIEFRRIYECTYLETVIQKILSTTYNK